MAEILLSFLSVIGLMFLTIYTCDLIFYRRFNKKLILTVDTRNFTVEECIEIFELITSIRQLSIGKAAINFVLVLIKEQEDEKTKLAEEYMRSFKIPGEIRKET